MENPKDSKTSSRLDEIAEQLCLANGWTRGEDMVAPNVRLKGGKIVTARTRKFNGDWKHHSVVEGTVLHMYNFEETGLLEKRLVVRYGLS